MLAMNEIEKQVRVGAVCDVMCFAPTRILVDDFLIQCEDGEGAARAGVSASAVQRSVIDISPDTPAARKLESWYKSEGQDLTARPAGEGLASALKCAPKAPSL